MENAKSFALSKTQWFNALVALLAAIDYQLPFLQSVLPVDKYQALLGFTLLGNVVLRFLTNQPITLPFIQPQKGTTSK